MTPAEFRTIADQAGGAYALAKLLGVSRQWVYQRISGKVAIKPLDEVAIRAVVKK